MNTFVTSFIANGSLTCLLLAGFFYAPAQTNFGSVPPCQSVMERLPFAGERQRDRQSRFSLPSTYHFYFMSFKSETRLTGQGMSVANTEAHDTRKTKSPLTPKGGKPVAHEVGTNQVATEWVGADEATVTAYQKKRAAGYAAYCAEQATLYKRQALPLLMHANAPSMRMQVVAPDLNEDGADQPETFTCSDDDKRSVKIVMPQEFATEQDEENWRNKRFKWADVDVVENIECENDRWYADGETVYRYRIAYVDEVHLCQVIFDHVLPHFVGGYAAVWKEKQRYIFPEFSAHCYFAKGRCVRSMLANDLYSTQLHDCRKESVCV